MRTFRLVFDPESIERRERGPAIGSVHARFDRIAFPAADWSDFALDFMTAYWEAVLGLAKKRRTRVSFYEGPYALRFVRLGDQVHIEALDREKPIHSVDIPYRDLLEHSMRAIQPWIEHEQAVGA